MSKWFTLNPVDEIAFRDGETLESRDEDNSKYGEWCVCVCVCMHVSQGELVVSWAQLLLIPVIGIASD